MQSLILQTENAITEVSRYVDDYDAFIGWIDTAAQDFEELEPSEQDAFADAFTPFSEYTEDTVPPEKVDSIHKELRNVLRKPILEAIVEFIEQVQTELGVDLSNSQVEAFRGELQSWSREKLIECRSTYESLIDEITELDTIERSYVGEQIKNKPHQLLDPKKEVLPLIQKTQSKNRHLRELTTALEEYDWNNLSGHAVGPFPEGWFEVEVPNPDNVKPLLAQLDDVVQIFVDSEIEVLPVLTHELSALIEQPSSDFSERLRELIEKLTEFSETMAPLQYIPELRELISGIDITVLDDSLLSEIEKQMIEHSPQRIGELSDLIRECRDKFDQWTSYVITQWQTYRSAVSVLTEDVNIHDLSGLDSDEEFEILIQREPIMAIEAFEELAITLDSYREDVGDGGQLSEAGEQLLFDLIEGQSVNFSEYDTETIENLADVIELQIRINESK
ncbi:hypothetical protein [Halorubrum distributum]|uniref:hypothetical protein n=1 Tax=Halorubrum distributum TaxID=29283 RepID=UPI0012681A0F|nr:hypothetical protein [Halorubrum arcis]